MKALALLPLQGRVGERNYEMNNNFMTIAIEKGRNLLEIRGVGRDNTRLNIQQIIMATKVFNEIPNNK
jgi:hypothetical protein